MFNIQKEVITGLFSLSENLKDIVRKTVLEWQKYHQSFTESTFFGYWKHVLFAKNHIH